jgi:small subunit ribosomal protein S8
MTRLDPLADALTNLQNHERTAKRACTITPASKLLGEVLRVLKEQQYIESFDRVKESHGTEKFTVQLSGHINQCHAIKPRYAVKKDGFEKYEKRYLPARDVGLLIVSTPKGVTTHKAAKDEQIGGRLLAYVY